MMRHSSQMERALAQFLRVFCFALISFTVAAQESNTWRSAARELVSATLAKASQPSSISLKFQNLSMMPPEGVNQTEAAIRQEFSARGTQLVNSESAQADVLITFSQNQSGWLWVAQMGHTPAQQIVMVAVPAAQVSLASTTPTIVLQKQLLWSQNGREPLLDFAILSKGNKLLALDASSVSLYQRQQSRWDLEQSQPIARSKPWPRDLRGRLIVRSDRKFDAFLPGKHCSGAADPGVSLECHDSDDPWPLGGDLRGFFGGRDFFTGVIADSRGSENVPPFFSAATLGGITVFAETDGSLRDLEGHSLSIQSGSDVAGVKNGCGRGWQLLATGTGDRSEADWIRAAETSSADARWVSDPIQFPGSITALWSTTDSDGAAAVIRNVSNGNYEAYAISITCR